MLGIAWQGLVVTGQHYDTGPSTVFLEPCFKDTQKTNLIYQDLA